MNKHIKVTIQSVASVIYFYLVIYVGIYAENNNKDWQDILVPLLSLSFLYFFSCVSFYLFEITSPYPKTFKYQTLLKSVIRGNPFEGKNKDYMLRLGGWVSFIAAVGFTIGINGLYFIFSRIR